ncbi:MAG: SIMPL domain-containing protein [Salinirussus sp.]
MRRNVTVVLAGMAVVLVAGAGIAAAIGPNSQQAQVGGTDDGSGPARTIQVSASGSAGASPDQTVVRVEVVATGPDAPTARKRLAENVSRMRSALETAGIGDDQVRTLRYDLERDRRERGPRENDGRPALRYRGSHSFEITVSTLDNTGTVIDTAVQNGADSVEDIQFTLSGEQRRTLRQTALENAMDNARTRAETLAAQSGLEITGVHSIRTTERGFRPRVELAAAGDGGGGTSIDTGDVTVGVQVHVTYNATAA